MNWMTEKDLRKLLRNRSVSAKRWIDGDGICAASQTITMKSKSYSGAYDSGKGDSNELD